MDEIQRVLIKAGHQDLAQQYYLKIAKKEAQDLINEYKRLENANSKRTHELLNPSGDVTFQNNPKFMENLLEKDTQLVKIKKQQEVLLKQLEELGWKLRGTTWYKFKDEDDVTINTSLTKLDKSILNKIIVSNQTGIDLLDYIVTKYPVTESQWDELVDGKILKRIVLNRDSKSKLKVLKTFETIVK